MDFLFVVQPLRSLTSSRVPFFDVSVCVRVHDRRSLSLFSSLLFLLLLSLFFSLFVGRARQTVAFSRFFLSLCVSLDIHVLEKTNGSIFSVRWLLLFSFFLHIDNRLR